MVRICAEPSLMCAAQTTPQVDAEIAEKDHFWIEINYEKDSHYPLGF